MTESLQNHDFAAPYRALPAKVLYQLRNRGDTRKKPNFRRSPDHEDHDGGSAARLPAAATTRENRHGSWLDPWREISVRRPRRGERAARRPRGEYFSPPRLHHSNQELSVPKNEDGEPRDGRALQRHGRRHP